ncbi:collagen, type I, alpha 1b-like [Oryctolagus cuniculus]|uniref:collagen, type I, alpha 1b-like n=1 Tax=Oryctolagus cuniculus TaxID=9986 RepID=UPI00387A6DDF
MRLLSQAAGRRQGRALGQAREEERGRPETRAPAQLGPRRRAGGGHAGGSRGRGTPHLQASRARQGRTGPRRSTAGSATKGQGPRGRDTSVASGQVPAGSYLGQRWGLHELSREENRCAGCRWGHACQEGRGCEESPGVKATCHVIWPPEPAGRQRVLQRPLPLRARGERLSPPGAGGRGRGSSLAFPAPSSPPPGLGRRPGPGRPSSGFEEFSVGAVDFGLSKESAGDNSFPGPRLSVPSFPWTEPGSGQGLGRRGERQARAGVGWRGLARAGVGWAQAFLGNRVLRWFCRPGAASEERLLPSTLGPGATPRTLGHLLLPREKPSGEKHPVRRAGPRGPAPPGSPRKAP